MRSRVLAAAIIAVFYWSAAGAAATDAHKTKNPEDYCVSEYDAEKWPEFIRWGLCDKYVASIGEGLRSGAAIAGYHACFPDDLSASDMNYVVSEYLGQSSGKEDRSPYQLVAAALSKAFPCYE